MLRFLVTTAIGLVTLAAEQSPLWAQPGSTFRPPTPTYQPPVYRPTPPTYTRPKILVPQPDMVIPGMLIPQPDQVLPNGTRIPRLPRRMPDIRIPQPPRWQ